MTARGYRWDLVALVAGGNEEEVLRTLLSSRWRSLGIREEVRYEILRHPRHDAGCRGEADALLRPSLEEAAHALVRKGGMEDLRAWLEAEGHRPAVRDQPENPKVAVESALRKAGLPRSSALYGAIARRVSLARCTDRAFLRLRKILRRWFGEERQR